MNVRHAVLPPAPRTSTAPGSRPPDRRPPAGPGRAGATGRSWDPVRFRAVEPVTPAAAAHDRRPGPELPGAPQGPLPEPAEWAAAVARAAVEGLLGSRPVHQLARWLATPVYVALSRRAGLAARVRGARRTTGVRVRSVVAAEVQGGVEASVTLHDGERFRAAAMRLEQFHGRWLVTALEIG